MRAKALFLVILFGLMTASATVNATAILVNSALDPSDPPRCTLHDAILAANTGVAVNGCKAGSGNDTISFSSGSKIVLKATLPTIERTLQINGRPANPKTVISGNNAVQVMSIDTSAVVTLSNLTLQQGLANAGGAISNIGSLTINSCAFINNTVTGSDAFGGAISNEGSLLSVNNSSFVNNSAFATDASFGGAIQSASPPVTITNCTFTGNSSLGPGGATGGAIVTAGATLLSATARSRVTARRVRTARRAGAGLTTAA
jgi:hypothetical protein